MNFEDLVSGGAVNNKLKTMGGRGFAGLAGAVGGLGKGMAAGTSVGRGFNAASSGAQQGLQAYDDIMAQQGGPNVDEAKTRMRERMKGGFGSPGYKPIGGMQL